MGKSDNTTYSSRIFYKKGDLLLPDGLTVAEPLWVDDSKDVLVHVSGLIAVDKLGSGKTIRNGGFQVSARWRHEVGTDKDIDHVHDWFDIPIIRGGCNVCIDACNNYLIFTTPGTYMLKFTNPETIERDIYVFAKSIEKGNSVVAGKGVFNYDKL